MSAQLIKKGTGNDPENPNGMNLYIYKGQHIYAYTAKDVPMRYKYFAAELNNPPKNGPTN